LKKKKEPEACAALGGRRGARTFGALLPNPISELLEYKVLESRTLGGEEKK